MSRASFKVEIANGETETIVKKATDSLDTLNYKKIESEVPGTHLFRRGTGTLTVPKYIELSVTTKDGKIYLKCDGYVTFNLFFTVGKIGELAFTDSIGYGAIPRKTGYKDFSTLKDNLGGGDIVVDPGKPVNRILLALTVIIPIIVLLVCCTCYIVIAAGEFCAINYPKYG